MPEVRMSRTAVAIAVLLLAGCGGGGEKPAAPLPDPQARLTVSSPVFRDGDTLPTRFTCAGEGASPPLAWSAVPKGARELTLVVEAPDAGRFVHWTVLGIPAATTGAGESSVPKGGVETEN